MFLWDYLSKLPPNSILAALSFSGAILLLLVTLFVKDVFSFTKDKEIIRDKPRFYTKFIGVLFILSLSFATNSPFVYLISIIIIATLVTELQFLEMLVALIWNRPEYIRGRFDELQKQQEEKESSTNLDEIKAIAQRAGEELKIETAKKNQYLLFYHFERVYRLIFGSQIRILLEAEQNEDRISLPRAVMFYRDSGWNERGYDAGNYTLFLLNMGLLTYTTGKMPEGCFYTLTPVGKSFLQYLRENGLSLDKPF